MIRTVFVPPDGAHLVPGDFRKQATQMMEAIPDEWDEVMVQPVLEPREAPTEYGGVGWAFINGDRYSAVATKDFDVWRELSNLYLDKVRFAFTLPFCSPCGKIMKRDSTEFVDDGNKGTIRRHWRCAECGATEQRDETL